MVHQLHFPSGNNEAVLEFDAGNTRLKWRLLRNGVIADAGYLSNSEEWRVQLPVLLDRLGPIRCARASVVSGSRRKALLKSVISEGFGYELFFAETRKSWLGLEVAYEHYTRLGVDRWLAMLAAHCKHSKHTKLIIDCGTALTLDIVDGNGCHLGGYIVPGLEMMRRSLHMNTAQLEIAEHSPEAILPGRTTEDCISRGVLSMAVSLVNAQLEFYPDALVYLAGGDGDKLKPHIKAETVFNRDLVMDGLRLAFMESD